jgi:hypothetical protein
MPAAFLHGVRGYVFAAKKHRVVKEDSRNRSLCGMGSEMWGARNREGGRDAD